MVKLPGVGKKTAERLVIEMRDKLADWCTTGVTGDTRARGSDKRHQTLQDAISALVSLGYKLPEANRTVTKIDDGTGSSEDLIRCALKEMV